MIKTEEKKQQEYTAEQIQTLVTTIRRANLNSRLGFTFNGRRDLYSALGYPQKLTFTEYLGKYERLAIANAIIDRPSEAAWQDGFTVVDETADSIKDTPFIEKWNALTRKLKLNDKFMRLDKVTCLGEYGVLFLGFNDVVKGNLRNPVNINGGRKKELALNYIKPIAQPNATITAWETKTTNPRYGKPVIYSITMGTPGSTVSTTVEVHHSRVIHVAYDTLENDYLGVPSLRPVYNNLLDIEKVVGGSGEMFWKGARPGYQSIVDKDYQINADDVALMKEEADAFGDDLNRIFAAKGIELKSLAVPLEKPTEYLAVQLEMVSAETGIPKRILTGSERGELASTQDMNSWLELIKTYRDSKVTPEIIIPFIDRLITFGILKGDIEKYSIVWPDLFSPSEKERVTIGLDRARALQEYSRNPFAAEIMPPEMFIKYNLGLTSLEVDEIKTHMGTIVVSEIEDEDEPIDGDT